MKSKEFIVETKSKEHLESIISYLENKKKDRSGLSHGEVRRLFNAKKELRNLTVNEK